MLKKTELWLNRFFIGVNEYDSYDMHVEAFIYYLTRWATTLSWKLQNLNGTNFEQGENSRSKHSVKRKNYDRGKKQI